MKGETTEKCHLPTQHKRDRERILTVSGVYTTK